MRLMLMGQVHLLSWDKLCKPKKDGGLGIRSTRIANSAFLMKVLRSFCTKLESLWCSVIKSKYRCGWRDFPIVDQRRKSSNFWNGLAKSWEEFRANLSWQIRDGESIRLWSDNWILGCDTLCNHCSFGINEDWTELPISHYVTQNGEWNFNLIGNSLPDEILHRISNIIPLQFSISKMISHGVVSLMVVLIQNQPTLPYKVIQLPIQQPFFRQYGNGRERKGFAPYYGIWGTKLC